MNQKIFNIFIFCLFALGIVLTLVRNNIAQTPLLEGETQDVWFIEARIDFIATNEAVSVDFNVPKNPPGFELIKEQSSSPGYGFNYITPNNNKRAQWTKRSANGVQTLYYKVQLKPTSYDAFNQIPVVEPTNKPQIPWKGSQAVAAQSIIEEAMEKSSDEISLTNELVSLLNQTENQNINLLLASSKKTALLQEFLTYLEVPNRLSYGLLLENSRRNQKLKPFIEVYSKKKGWQLYSAKNGHIEDLSSVLLWSQNTDAVLDVIGGDESSLKFSMLKRSVPAMKLQETQENSLFELFSVHNLPVEEQNMFKMMLLLPAGALVVVFMRIIVGLKTSGTFMPVLIALAFIQTSFLPGLISFISIVIIGLLLRSYLSHLNLLMVSRISAIIIIVIFIIGMLSIIGYHLGFNTGMTVTFFPIIIIAWTIERMSILWEEEGAVEVLIQGGGSLIVATLTYIVMQWSFLGHLTFNFPEINLSIIALILLLGRYSGYRLSELYRFRNMDFK